MEVKEELVEVTLQLEMEKAREQGLIERAERAEEALQKVKGKLIERAERTEEALQAERIYSRQGRTVLYL